MSDFLTPDQEAWLTERVARGDFPSISAAVRQLLDERMDADIGDLVWAKPLVDEALADVADGRLISREQHEARMVALMAAMKG